VNAALTDGLAAAERLLLKLRHDPAAIVLTLGAPVALVVIFGYIFGSAISVPGGDYRAYLVSGLFATIAANIVPSMVAAARDSTRGVVDRFRSLPITDAVAALALLAAFQFAATWAGIYLGLLIGKETAAQASILVFPVTMLSNVFVPTAGMPAWLRAVFVPLATARYARPA
jgi:ABC-2 type transport system permease protein